MSNMKNNEYSSITLQKNEVENFPIEIDLLNKNISNLKKIKFIDLDKDDLIKINKGFNKSKRDAKKVRR